MYDRRLLSFLPHWPLALDQLGWVALILIVAGVLGEAARAVRLPRLLGYVIAGMFLGPPSPRLMSGDTLAAMRPLLDVTLGVLLFELGHRIDLTSRRVPLHANCGGCELPRPCDAPPTGRFRKRA